MLFNSWIIIDLESFIAGKINYNWRIFHCHVTIIRGYSWGLNGIKLADCMIFVFFPKKKCMPQNFVTSIGNGDKPSVFGVPHLFGRAYIYGLCVFSLMYRCGMHMVFSCWGQCWYTKFCSFPRPKTMRLFGFGHEHHLHQRDHPYLLTTKGGSTTTILRRLRILQIWMCISVCKFPYN